MAETKREIQRKGTKKKNHGSPIRPEVLTYTRRDTPTHTVRPAESNSMRGDGNATSTREFRAAQHPRSRWGGSSPGHGAIGLDAVLEAVELPAGVADLDPGLPDVDADDLSHRVRCCRRVLPRLGLGLEENGAVSCVSLSPSKM
jgi:hypothetical protein